VDECKTEQEAREKARLLNDVSKSYPVLFFKTDTSGEKSFEEFYTTRDQVSFNRFIELGVIENAPKKPVEVINQRFDELHELFGKNNVTKKTIVNWLSKVVEGFHHIETGKNLDQKM